MLAFSFLSPFFVNNELPSSAHFNLKTFSMDKSSAQVGEPVTVYVQLFDLNMFDHACHRYMPTSFYFKLWLSSVDINIPNN